MHTYVNAYVYLSDNVHVYVYDNVADIAVAL